MLKKTVQIFGYFLTTLTISGCSSLPTQEQIAGLDYGTYPVEYKNIIQNYLDFSLKDPDSRKVQFLKPPRKGWNTLTEKFGNTGQITAGYEVCVYVNAKNSFGGYTGSKMTWFLIKNNVVSKAVFSTNKGQAPSIWVDERCD